MGERYRKAKNRENERVIERARSRDRHTTRTRVSLVHRLNNLETQRER